MSDDKPAALYEVPAHDDRGKSVTLRLRPASAAVTVEVIDTGGAALAKVSISITNTGRFASFFGACAMSASNRAIGDLS